VIAGAAFSIPSPARADSLSELKIELSAIRSQIKHLDAQSPHFTPARRDELAQIKSEVAVLQSQMDEQAESAAAPPVQALAPAPKTKDLGVSFGSSTPPGPKVQEPKVGGIPLITSPGGAFFIAGTLDAGVRDDNGAGHSVMDVIRAVEQVGGRKVPARMAGRRPGDPAILVAASARLRRETGWSPRYAALDNIVRTAFAWRESHPAGYGDR